MVQSFCCCHLWFGSSKIVLSTVGIDKTQKSGHLFTILLRGSNAISQLYVRKDSSAPLHFQKASTPSVSAHCVTEEFSLPCKEAFKAPQAVNTSRWSIRLQHAFIHPHLVLSCQLPRKSEGRQWNTNFREGKKARKKLAFWLLALLYKAMKKGDNTTQDLESDERID